MKVLSEKQLRQIVHINKRTLEVLDRQREKVSLTLGEAVDALNARKGVKVADEIAAYFCDKCGRMPTACKRCKKCGGKVTREIAG